MEPDTTPEFTIELDWSRSTLADWELVASIGKGLEFSDIPHWIEFLDRVVVGGKSAFPMTALKPVIEFVAASLSEQMNPKAKAG